MNENKKRPETEEEFLEYIRSSLNERHNYETSAEAVSNIAIAAFNYAANTLGITGFQAGWASLRALGEIKGIDGPFGIIKAEDFLFPQYDNYNKIQEWHDEWLPYLKQKATENIKEASDLVHPDVMKRWKEYAKEEE